MARKRKFGETDDDLAGTVEGLARDHFEREKAAYEERTGQEVRFEPPVPVTRTPLAAEPAEEEPVAEIAAEGEGEV